MMQSSSDPVLRGNFVLLRAGNLRLLMHPHEVGAAACLGAPPRSGDTPGLFVHRQGQTTLQVACLSSRLRRLAAFPADRFVATPLLGTDDEAIAWAWSDLRVLIGIELQPRPLPPVLCAPGMPVHAYALHEGAVVFMGDAHRMAAYAFAADVDDEGGHEPAH